MKNSLIWGAIALSPAFAYADYQFEAIGGYGQVDTTTTVNTFGPIFVGGTVVFTDRIKQEADIHQIGGRLHFDTVSTKVGPLAEAAFLSHSSFVDLSYASSEPDDSAFDNTDTYRFAGRLVSASKLIAEVTYIDSHFSDQNDSEVRAGIGAYLSEHTDLVVSYQTNTDSDKDFEIVDAELHGLAQLSDINSLAYDLGVAYIDNGDDEGYGFSAGASYYFTRSVGFGLDASLEEVGEQNFQGVTAMLTLFPTENIQLVALLFDQSMEIDNFLEVESDGFSVGVTLRF